MSWGRLMKTGSWGLGDVSDGKVLVHSLNTRRRPDFGTMFCPWKWFAGMTGVQAMNQNLAI
jgi:hypothetical protein